MVVSTVIPPYYEMAKGQQKTWDSVFVEGVRTVYYYSGDVFSKNKISEHSEELIVECLPELHHAHWRFRQAICNVDYENYDFIFRTNNSSYVNKKLLLEFAETLPTERCYCGIDGDGFASGSGFFISPDCTNILKEKIKDEDYWAEDHLYGKLLLGEMIPVTDGAQRIDIDTRNYHTLATPCYHYRCKDGYRLADGSLVRTDVDVMKKLFEIYGVSGEHNT